MTSDILLVDDPETRRLIQEAVQEYRVSAAQAESLGLRPLSPAVKTLLWALRGYVLFMVIIVIWNIVTMVH